jgi:hypothetical protein
MNCIVNCFVSTLASHSDAEQQHSHIHRQPIANATMSAIKEDPDNGTSEPLAKRVRTEGVRRHYYTVAKQRVVRDPEEHEGFTHDKLVEILTKAVRIWDKLSPIYCNNDKYQFIGHHLHRLYTTRFPIHTTKLQSCRALDRYTKGFKYVDEKDTIAALQDILETVFPRNKFNQEHLQLLNKFHQEHLQLLKTGQGVLKDIFEKVRDSILVDISS